jgi:hypothetical protein
MGRAGSFGRLARRRGLVGVLGAVGLAAAGLAAPATATTGAAPPTADIGVVSLRADATTAQTGDLVTFREVVVNNGPETVELDTRPLIRGGRLVDEVCEGVSPDTPFCEYGFVAPGTRLHARFVVKVTRTDGQLTVSGGVQSEQPLQDDNPFNQYLTRSVAIG